MYCVCMGSLLCSLCMWTINTCYYYVVMFFSSFAAGKFTLSFSRQIYNGIRGNAVGRLQVLVILSGYTPPFTQQTNFGLVHFSA